MIINDEDFARLAIEAVGEPGPFEPFVHYNSDGDCIEFLAKGDSFFARRVDDLLTVYYSHETGEVVGSLIKDAKKLMRKTPKVKIVYKEGAKVKLVHLLVAASVLSAAGAEEETRTLIYSDLIGLVEESGLEAELVSAT